MTLTNMTFTCQARPSCKFVYSMGHALCKFVYSMGHALCKFVYSMGHALCRFVYSMGHALCKYICWQQLITQSIHPPVHTCIHPSIRLCIHPSICPCIHPSVHTEEFELITKCHWSGTTDTLSPVSVSVLRCVPVPIPILA